MDRCSTVFVVVRYFLIGSSVVADFVRCCALCSGPLLQLIQWSIVVVIVVVDVAFARSRCNNSMVLLL